MTSMIRLAAVCLVGLFVCQGALAADSKALLATPGKLLFEDSFAGSDMKPKWKVGKGAWELKDGFATVAEIPADHHGAYAYIDPNVPYTNVVAEFTFKLDGARTLEINMRDSNYKGSHAGHVLRAAIQPDKVQLVDMITGGMKMEYYLKNADPNTTPAEKKEIQAKIKDKTTTFKNSVSLDEWHQARVEVAGDEMLMSIDGKPVGYIKSEGIAHPTKNMLGFTVWGKTAAIKDAKFFDASPAPEWANQRADVLASLKK
jgi:hypothetical protein